MFRLMCWLGLKLLRASGAKVTVIPSPVVRFTVSCPDRGWEYRYYTEPEVRAFVGAYYDHSFPAAPDLIVTRFVNNREDAQVTVTQSTFDPALPLFPLEASAN